MDVRPEVEADGRVDERPLEPAVRKARAGRTDGLPDREVDVVRRNLQGAGADPDLGQPGVDIDERRAPGARQQPGVDAVMEVEHEVGSP